MWGIKYFLKIAMQHRGIKYCIKISMQHRGTEDNMDHISYMAMHAISGNIRMTHIRVMMKQHERRSMRRVLTTLRWVTRSYPSCISTMTIQRSPRDSNMHHNYIIYSHTADERNKMCGTIVCL